MNGWHILAGCIICGTGALVFLGLVADEIEQATAALRLYEKRAQQMDKNQSEPSPELGTVFPEAA
jgi:hypothetical protein